MKIDKVGLKRFDPSEKEILCEVCGRPMIIETYKCNKDEQAFLMSKRIEKSHKKCMKSRRTANQAD
jgi:uncharacterized cysteine cluster protein YcgN (CxxCxxCC family)